MTSTAITTNSSGARLTELRYFAYGGTRYDAGSQMTLYRYTGQRTPARAGGASVKTSRESRRAPQALFFV